MGYWAFLWAEKRRASLIFSDARKARFGFWSAAAMASPPATSSAGDFAVRRQSRGPPFKFLVPLIYAPVLPLIRIGLRRNPVLRDQLFTAVLAGGFLHGFYLVTDLYDAESK